MVMPVAQEYTGLTTFCLGLCYEPLYELFAVIVVYTTVAFEAKVYVRKTGYLFKECHGLPFLLNDWFMIGHVYLVLELHVVKIIRVQFAFFL